MNIPFRVLTGVFVLAAVLTGNGAESKSPAPAELGELVLSSGAVYRDVKVQNVDPDGLRIRHATGLAKVKTGDLPAAVRKRFGLTEEAAAAHQDELARAEEAAREEEREEMNLRMSEEARAALSEETTAIRTEWFAEISSGRFDYVALESAMRGRAAILRESGRDDLATLIDEDRDVLKRAQVARAADAFKADRDALVARVKELEVALADAKVAAPPPRVEVVDRLVEVPVVVPWVTPNVTTPTVVRPVVPHPHIHQPAQPNAGAHVHPPTPRPATPAPAVPHTIHGAHLWQPR